MDLKHKHQNEDSPVIEFGIDLSEFYLSVEWDIMGVPARRKEKFYSCCEEPYPDITFNITLRRKTLFYTVNLIIPCVAISFLSVLVFYLPSDSGEKVSLSISIMLSLGVFFLLLSEIIPPTSLTVPLLGKYLLFTMILVSLSVVVTIAVLNVNFRSPATHKMSPWVRRVFLEFLPKVMMMRRPDDDKDEEASLDQKPISSVVGQTFEGVEIREPPGEKPGVVQYECSYHGTTYTVSSVPEDLAALESEVSSAVAEKRLCPELERAILNVRFIAQHMENRDSYSSVSLTPILH